MDDHPDPSAQFFPDVALEDIDLYAVLNLSKGSTTTSNDVKRSYRKLALVHHPDKHAQDKREEQSLKFQQIGFAYAVLSDEARRARYDSTGRTDDGGGVGGLDPGEGGWEAYFADLFDGVTRGKLDEMKREYQGSQEEVDDLRAAYELHEGSIEGIMSEIPHSTYEDEPRLVAILTPLVASGALPKYPAWTKGVGDVKAAKRRRAEGEKEAKLAEQHARDTGVWDEFYGSGKEGARKAKGKGKQAESAEGDDGEDVLRAMILKRQAQRGNALDGLLAKYGGAEGGEPPRKKGKKAATPDEEDDEEIPRTKKKKSTATSSRSSSRVKK